MRYFDAVMWKEEGLWTARCPSVPGCYGVGKTRREAMGDLSSAVREMVAYLKSIGEAVRASKSVVVDKVAV